VALAEFALFSRWTRHFRGNRARLVRVDDARFDVRLAENELAREATKQRTPEPAAHVGDVPNQDLQDMTVGHVGFDDTVGVSSRADVRRVQPAVKQLQIFHTQRPERNRSIVEQMCGHQRPITIVRGAGTSAHRGSAGRTQKRDLRQITVESGLTGLQRNATCLIVR